MHYERTTLQNGVRLLTTCMPGMRSASIAFFFAAGSRYEPDHLAGISHFIEHMLFKGSKLYPSARLISEAIEGVGGVFNGSTGKELTSYTARVPAEQLDVVIDVLADMIRHPLFDPEEIEKERHVIMEELSSTRDDPQEWSGLLLDEAMWPGLPLGRDDAGRDETVATISRQDMLDYLERFYLPNSLVVSVAGNVNHAHVREAIEWLFHDWQPRPRPGWLPCPPPRDVAPVALISKETEQTNLCLGTLGVAHSSPDYYVLMLLNAILGDGMSSRLFQDIREERGLAYDICSYTSSYYETGNLVISAGVDPSQTAAAIQAIVQELESLCKVPVAQEELERFKAYVRGGLILGLEGTQQIASWLGSQECLLGRIVEVDEMIAQINAVTPEDIRRVARTCFAPEWRRLAMIGPEDPRQIPYFQQLLTGV
jgi:predicted Zn-dependent peptidase